MLLRRSKKTQPYSSRSVWRIWLQQRESAADQVQTPGDQGLHSVPVLIAECSGQGYSSLDGRFDGYAADIGINALPSFHIRLLKAGREIFLRRVETVV